MVIEVWQKLSNNIIMPVYFAYCAGIMLDAFGYQLCRHNQPGPSLVLQSLHFQSLKH